MVRTWQKQKRLKRVGKNDEWYKKVLMTWITLPYANKVMFKILKLGFRSTWTEDFQMFKLGLEKAEEPEIKLPTLGRSWIKQSNSRKTSISASLTMLSLWLCCYCSVTKSYLTLCDPMDCSMSGFPVLHYLPEFAQMHVHRVSDVIQPSRPLLSPSHLALNLSQHQGLFHWVSISHQVAKVLELQHQSFQWIFRFDFL